MSAVRTSEIYDILNELAPFDTAEAFDNAGFLLGRADALVENVLCALDVTMEVVEEAKALNAQLIVSHHPLFFHGHKNLLEGLPENDVICEMIRSRIALISAHTNLDKSPLSGSACAARRLKLQNIRQEGYLFIGDVEGGGMRADELGQKIRDLLKAPLRIFGDQNEIIHTLAIAGGAYGEGYQEILDGHLGAEAYMTGEIRHHEAVDAVARGLVLYEGGHYATEQLLVPELADYLQTRLNALQYTVRVYPSTCVAYPGALV